MDSYSQSPSSGAPPRKKLKIGNGNACELCRSKKIKCDGMRPACGNCHKKQHVCIYQVNATTVTQEQATKIPGIGYSGSPGTFAGEVKAAIDARFGAIPNGLSNAMPMSDAPLFELQLPRRRPSDEHLDKVLPPRRQADELLHAFWRYINPVDCFLDKKRFCRSYEALFAGGDLGTDEHTFICTLNVVFAFATQSHESKVASERDAAANTYFLRAWNLLNPETILWEPPSLQIVECLLLMSRYLQSYEFISPKLQTLASQMIKRTGNTIFGTAAFPRTISWMLGHTLITSLEALPSSTSRKYSYDNYLPETNELYEISRYFVKAQTSTSGNVAEKFGLSGQNQRKESYCSVVLQHESCLIQWEKARLGTTPLEESENHDLKLRRHILKLR
ncbi:fungal specific transcription factor domain-containing protein [Trichoderma gamsii]|uniref:Fungal specific transcription factor domain-containing protein n=1 Tax=Trichoderma gamsii TaxID=398673 RepID=A0A2P4ZQR3_9HYPO|nr:fungal specific transcription factor domain-containing protein [Trichoderma gamsii]PON26635.1 fungal specific transcription factor domain-containing protein [Trichoderma gamsii]